jgi:hypothetical protein
MRRETENQWRRPEATRKWIAELHAFFTDRDRKHRTAERVVSLWDKRHAIRAGKLAAYVLLPGPRCRRQA